MREIRATKLTATDVADVIGGEVVLLYAGKLGFRAIMVPASEFWQHKVEAEYSATGQPYSVSREGLAAEHIVITVTRQVDDKWNPWTYGRLIHADKCRAFILPDNPYWRGVVAEKEEQ